MCHPRRSRSPSSPPTPAPPTGIIPEDRERRSARIEADLRTLVGDVYASADSQAGKEKVKNARTADICRLLAFGRSHTYVSSAV